MIPRSLILVGCAAALATALAWAARETPEPVAAPEKPQRIVALTVAAAEILLEIVPRDRIAAVHALSGDPSFSNIAGELEGIPRVTSEVEPVLAVMPDLVLSASYVDKAFAVQLEHAGLRVESLPDPHDLESIAANVLRVGALVGEPERAAEVAARMGDEVEAARRERRDLAPTVLFLDGTGIVAGSGTTLDAVAEAAGVRNFGAEHGIVGYREVPSETLLSWAPDVIVVSRDGPPGSGIRRVMQEGVGRVLPATTRVVEVPYPQLTAVSPYVTRGVRALAEAVSR